MSSMRSKMLMIQPSEQVVASSTTQSKIERMLAAAKPAEDVLVSWPLASSLQQARKCRATNSYSCRSSLF